MAKSLQPDTVCLEQRVLVLGGMGGIGKTQLAIVYAKRYRASYTSIFWMNATSETTLKGSLRSVARRIFPPDAERQSDDDQIKMSVSRWLSEQDNTQWLLIFDNYDEPDQYPIKQYYPYASYGSIIITTRLPEQVIGEKIKVSTLSNGDESLRILETRSGRRGVQSGNRVFVLCLLRSY
jgi:NB-ARC domain